MFAQRLLRLLLLVTPLVSAQLSVAWLLNDGLGRRALGLDTLGLSILLGWKVIVVLLLVFLIGCSMHCFLLAFQLPDNPANRCSDDSRN